ncbi:zeta toxin-domain-containing protein [Schizothecium vesticola]|uniref:Zeta toxin-domain-containing protein n=1 Tax=Schizothecium vesticola TaxID=314040 RepID=A0AA40F8N9_9PEZI|nr:zeta toxin-domain-containing protein [Schizothecium vesticola]
MPPPPPTPLETYTLSPADHLSIFTTTILPTELAPHHSHPHRASSGHRPLAVLILGQTGAGKTRLAPLLLAALSRGGGDDSPPVHLIADTYKAYHPHYAVCLPAASADARKWLAMACEHVVERRMDVLVESACRYPGDFCELVEIFGRGGYAVRVAVLAVPEGLSRLGILRRYYGGLEEGRGRLTPRGVHDESYEGLREAVGWLDGRGGEGVVVVRRGNLLAHRGGGAAAALEVERKRALTGEEREVAERDMEELRRLGDPGVDAQLQEIQGLLDGLGSVDGGELQALRADEFITDGLEA